LYKYGIKKSNNKIIVKTNLKNTPFDTLVTVFRMTAIAALPAGRRRTVAAIGLPTFQFAAIPTATRVIGAAAAERSP
jgi:hypothetical protein